MPSPEVLNAALAEIRKGGYSVYNYFFEKLNSADWLEPLAAGSVFNFASPPEPIAKGEYLSFPPWPESRYLVRMAAIPEAQSTVTKIALNIPETDNPYVHDDLIDIALKLPAELAVQLVGRAESWLESPYKRLVSYKIPELIAKLASGGQADGALELLGQCLALSPDPLAGEKRKDAFGTPKPQTRLDDWHYGQVLDKAVPVVVKSAGVQAVHVLAKLLASAIILSQREDQTDDGVDHLHVWCSAIERGAHRDHIPSALLCAVRDASEQVVRGDGSQFEAVVAELKSHGWVSFQRLVLHLCRIFPEKALREAQYQFEDPAILERSGTSHEATLLIQDVFSELPKTTQERILDWIELGPDKESVGSWLGDQVTPESVDEHCDRWRRDHLAILSGQLPEPWQQQLEQLIAKLGPSQSLDLPESGAVWVGRTSPTSADDLRKLDPTRAVEYLNSWEPKPGLHEASPDGLGSVLSEVVASESSVYAHQASAFEGVDPTYVRCFFVGLQQALKQGAVFPWEPVIQLARWVAEQPREIPGRSGRLGDRDPDWGWTRKAIASLVADGLEEGAGTFRHEHREDVWAVIVALLKDPEPSPQYEREYGGDNMDPSMMSINTVRGEVFHTTIRFAFWVRRCLDSHLQTAPETRSFEEMSEVQEVLEAYLDPALEPSLTIRSVYGRWLPQLAHLDWAWTQANVGRIFPTEETEIALFRAAWESFVAFTRPHQKLLSLMLPYYGHAIEQLSVVDSQMRRPYKPDDSLAEHLAIYYWWGRLEIEGDDTLLRSFFDRASPETRRHLIWFVGSASSNWEETAPAEVFERLRNLLEYRLQVARSSDEPASCSEELAAFGLWFATAEFGEQWLLRTLLAILELTQRIDSEMGVIERLREMCPTYPVECVTALRYVVSGATEPWTVHAIEKDAKELLRIALHLNNSEAATKAKRLTELIIAQGFPGFQTVLD